MHSIFLRICPPRRRNCTGPVNNYEDYIPFLQLFTTPIFSRATELRRLLLATYGGMIRDIDSKIQAGEDVPDCMVKAMLMSQDTSDLEMTYIAAAFMVGGVESVRFLQCVPSRTVVDFDSFP